MEQAGAAAWAATFSQLMAESKPQDTWLLLPEGSLVAGRLDSGCSQYRLKGLARLQCCRCPWGWGSAHVQILFLLSWDEASRQGLVKMRVWGQRCRLCPRGSRSDCQVSPPSVRPFLNKLALHVLRKVYGESPGPEQRPALYVKAPGHAARPCEACALGVCFLQKVPGMVLSPRAIRGSYTMYSGVGLTITASRGAGSALRNTQLLALGGGPSIRRPRGGGPFALHKGCFTVPLSVSDFIRNPLTDSSHFFSKGEGVITIPFSLADEKKDPGPVAGIGHARNSSRPATHTIGKGSLCLSANSLAIPEGRGLPVNIKDPVFHGEGLLISNVEAKGFELKGFIFKGKGSISDPVDVAKVQGLATPAARSPLPVSYIIGLMANGEGSITFPLSFTNIIKDKDSFASVSEGKGKEGGSDGPATAGHHTLLEANAYGPPTADEGALTFPFIFTEGFKDKDGRLSLTQGPAAAADGCLLESSAGGPLAPSASDAKGKGSSAATAQDEGEEGGSPRGPVPNVPKDNSQDKELPMDTIEDEGPQEGGSSPPAPDHDPLLKASTGTFLTFSEGSITIPFSVFSIIKRKGPRASASAPQGHHGLLPPGLSKKKKRLRSRFSKSSCGPPRDEDFCPAIPCRGLYVEPYEDVWIWVSMTVCVLWLMCMYKLSPGIFQQQA
ncbi:receptor-transporting protein 5 [Echinops telfairi]|uniref:Receptor-transporting protein 5 n=1 Tax=Echinops telfairi TaxID=9371 RepID=A0ABM0IK92_ECHTE|nr:receptor-transporting protein 5 [Echinops telfairi]